MRSWFASRKPRPTPIRPAFHNANQSRDCETIRLIRSCLGDKPSAHGSGAQVHYRLASTWLTAFVGGSSSSNVRAAAAPLDKVGGCGRAGTAAPAPPGSSAEACLNRLHRMGPGFSNWEAKVNPTVADQGKAVATVTADDVAHADHEVYEAPKGQSAPPDVNAPRSSGRATRCQSL